MSLINLGKEKADYKLVKRAFRPNVVEVLKNEETISKFNLDLLEDKKDIKFAIAGEICTTLIDEYEKTYHSVLTPGDKFAISACLYNMEDKSIATSIGKFCETKFQVIDNSDKKEDEEIEVAEVSDMAQAISFGLCTEEDITNACVIASF